MCPQGPRPPGSVVGEAAYVALQLHHPPRLPTASKASAPDSAPKAFPLGSSLPRGAPDVDTERNWPLQSPAGSWPPSIFSCLPYPMVWLLLSPWYRGEN